MINIVAQGGSHLKDLGDEASRLGFALNAVDTAKAVEAEEAMLKLGSAATGFANILAVQLAPYLTFVIEKYTEWGYAGTKSADKIAQGMNLVKTTVEYVAEGVNVLSVAFYAYRTAADMTISAVAAGFGLLLEGIQAVIQGTQALAGGMNATLDAALQATSDKIASFGAGVKAFREEMEKAAKVDFKNAADAFNNIGKPGKQVRNLLDEFEAGAKARAQKAANNNAKFIEPGELRHNIEPTKFAATMERGSKEAYSAILGSRGMQQNAQQQIALNTKIGADAGQQQVAILREMNKKLDAQGMPAMPNLAGPNKI